MPRAEFTNNTKAIVFRRQNGKCAECGRKMGVGGEAVEYNHIQPAWEGGSNSPENCEALCAYPCHARKTGKQAGQRAEARRHTKKQAGLKKKKRLIPGSKGSGWRHTFRDGFVRETP